MAQVLGTGCAGPVAHAATRPDTKAAKIISMERWRIFIGYCPFVAGAGTIAGAEVGAGAATPGDGVAVVAAAAGDAAVVLALMAIA
jgi:hypothetical protein